MEPDQASLGPRINDARSAARSLSARNAVVFDCVHSLDACREKLAEIAREKPLVPPRVTQAELYRAKMEAQPVTLEGTVDAESVDLARGLARFRGRWTQGPDGVRLEGVVEPAARGLVRFSAAFGPLLLVAAIALNRPEAVYLIVALIVAVIAMPLVVLGLGSTRASDEIALVRAIGTAIGDPEKYAARWRRWKAD